MSDDRMPPRSHVDFSKPEAVDKLLVFLDVELEYLIEQSERASDHSAVCSEVFTILAKARNTIRKR